MITIAHRGASAYFKENTLPAFKAAFDLGALFMETDLQRSKDGVLVLYHDYSLPNGQNIKDLNYSALRKLHVPTLQELFKTAKNPNIKINIEIKNDGNLYPNIEKQLFSFLKDEPSVHLDRLLISSFDFDTLRQVRRLNPSVKIGLLTRDFNLAQALQINAYSVNMSVKRINSSIVKTCRKHHLKTFIYTVNDYRTALKLQKMGVDGIFSDFPQLLNPNFLNIGLSV